LLADTDGGLPLREVARRLRLHPSTAHRLLATLIGLGFVEYADHNYCVGLEAFAIGAAFLRRSAVRRRALPFMMKISEKTRLTTNLGFWHRGGVVIADSFAMGGGYQYETGNRVPAYATALGKALLAFGRRHELERIAPLHQYTEKTITNPKALSEELDCIHHRGYSVDAEEFLPGCVCVAAPIIHEHGNAVAAISVTGPESMMSSGRIAELGTLLRERCGNVATQLAFSRESQFSLAKTS
jgi:IclR family acetate operon transcriptional repressor